MSKKPVEVLNIGFNEALQRIAKFDKEKLPVDNKVDEVKKSKKTNPYQANRIIERVILKKTTLIQY